MLVDLTAGHEVRVTGRSALEVRCAGRTIWWAPTVMFASAEQGGWYDPSDLSTLFQDSAGTIPVTTVGQPVGKMLDKSGRGNHLVQTTSNRRPTYQNDGTRGYLLFDGLDDALFSASAISFTSTDAVTALVGVGINTAPAATSFVFELSANAGSNNGAFYISAAPTTYNFLSRGTTLNLVSATLSAMSRAVLTGLAKISTPVATVRKNGAQVATSSATQGTGNYGNHVLYIGARGGTFNHFSGALYSLIIRGAPTDATTLAKAEAWVNGKTGAF